MPIDAALIQNQGWRQGSVFSLPVSAPIIRVHRNAISVPGFVIPDEARLLLVSQDCDIVYAGPHEPRIEVCPAVPVTGGLDGNFTATRNPRRLQIEIAVAGVSQAHELRAPTRFFLPREILQESAPDTEVTVDIKYLRYVRHWLSKRYNRAALPTNFDQRVPKKTRSQIRKLLHPLTNVHSLLIAIDPIDEELGPNDDYAIQIVSVVESDSASVPAQFEIVERAMKSLERLLEQCEGIALEVCEAQSSSKITLDVLQEFAVWDFDDVSFDTGGAVPERPA